MHHAELDYEINSSCISCPVICNISPPNIIVNNINPDNTLIGLSFY